MIEPLPATTIMIAFLIVWAVIIPVVGIIPKVKEIISYRYLLITVFLACMIGVIINFSGLDSSIRVAVIIGTFILSGLYILLRSFEKWCANGWTFGRDIEASVSKGDIHAELKLNKKEDSNAGDE